MSDQDFERKEKARQDAMFDAQFADEPTSDVDYADEPHVNGWPLYSGLPRREWQGLTDEEIFEIWSEPKKPWLQLVRAIEAALKAKNA